MHITADDGRAKRVHFTDILESMLDSVVLVNQEGVIERANAATMHLFQLEKDRVLGRPLEEFLDEGSRRQFRVPAMLSEGEDRRLDLVCCTGTGERTPISMSVSILREHGEPVGLICVARDVTATKEIEESLRRSEARFRCLVDNAGDPFFVLDDEGRITEVNQAACVTLGYDREELLTLGLADVEVNVTLEQYREIWQTLVPGEPVTVVGVARRKDGTTLDVEVRVSHVELNGYERIFALVRDVTERRKVEDELIEAREAAIAASRLKSEFLANMSHEIRTPMNAVIGLTELVLDTELTWEQREYLETVKASAESLLSVIEDILYLSKIEAGELELDERPFSMSACVSAPLRALESRAREKNLDLVLDLPDDVSEAVVGDARRIGQIVTNLVSNAVKFTERGQIVVRVRRVPSDASTAELRFSVADTGIGIPREKLDIIFEPFAQGDGSATRRFGGAGLGLAICRKLTSAMGGRIWAESDPGKGSTFHVSLPLRLQSDESYRRADAIPAEHERPAEANGGRSLRILLAEDSPVNRIVVERILEKRGHEVVWVGSGDQAVLLVEREAFDLILMDIQMPGLDGFEATARIRGRETESGNRIPIIALTAHAMEGDRDRCLAEGMDDYIAKPIRKDELWDAIERWGGLRRPDRTPSPAVDLTHLATQTRADRDLERELARMYLEEAPSLLQRLRDGLAGHDGAALARAAHRLKGSLSTLGAFRAAEALDRIESAARRGDMGVATRLGDDVEGELHDVELELAAIANRASTVA